MLIGISPRTPLLLAVVVTGLLAWGENAPALAACTPGAADKPDLGFVDSNCDGKVAFLGATGDVGVYGGYDAQTWQRSAANVTTLRAPGQVVGVANPGIVLQLLTVHSVSGPTYKDSYGVRAFGGGTVALSRVTVQAAPGAQRGGRRDRSAATGDRARGRSGHR
jgi:hypothetical protein